MADIPLQRLNVDPSGYAGPMLTPMGGPGTGSGYGIPKEFMRMLAEQQALRRQQAEMQLALMKEDLQASREGRRAARGGLNYATSYGGGRQHVGRLEGKGPGPQELGAAAASTLDPGNRLGRTASDFLKLGQYMQFLGPDNVGAGSRVAGEGFGNLARQATANAPAFGALEAEYGRGGPSSYGFLSGSSGGRWTPGGGRFTASQTNSRAVRGRQEKGTLPGTVPKTGNYQLHKHEIVVSAPQVAPGGKLDTGLMSYLIEDKMRKGITKENPKGAKGYQAGSLRGYAMPSIEPGMAAALGLGMYGGGDIIKGQPPPMVPPPPMAPEEKPGFLDWLRDALGGGGGPTEEDLKAEARARFQESLPFQDPGVLGSKFDSRGEAPMRSEQFPGMTGAAPGMEQAPPTPDLGIPENLDLEVALSRVRGGDLGSRENPLTLSGSSGLGPNSAGITAPPGGRGDEYLPPAERTFAPESQEWREAQSQKIMATTNRAKADRIRDHLLREGMNMDSDTRKDLMRGAEWLDSMADMVEERAQMRKDQRLEREAANEEAIKVALKEKKMAEVAGDKLTSERRMAQEDKLDTERKALKAKYLDPKIAEDEDDRQGYARAMAANLVAKARLNDQEMDPNEAMVYALAEVGDWDGVRAKLEETEASPEQIEEVIAELGGI